ncbi:hypothetical protein ZWY2020_054593 [Hordeum vulgare]|nr:hypothetical protein ZWY2020_054593 [Hordeum vulgare]
MAAPTTVLLLLLLVSSCAVGAYADALPEPVNEEVLGWCVPLRPDGPSGALAAWAESDATPCGWPHVECDLATSPRAPPALDGLGLSSASGVPCGLDRLLRLQSPPRSQQPLRRPPPRPLLLPPSASSTSPETRSRRPP